MLGIGSKTSFSSLYLPAIHSIGLLLWENPLTIKPISSTVLSLLAWDKHWMKILLFSTSAGWDGLGFGSEQNKPNDSFKLNPL